MLYASVPSTVGTGGNSITTIDPLTTAVVGSVFVGSEPDKLALSDDGHSLYTSLAGAFSIRRFDVVNQTPSLESPVGFDLFFGRYNVADLVVAPANPNLPAVARSYGGISPAGCLCLVQSHPSAGQTRSCISTPAYRARPSRSEWRKRTSRRWPHTYQHQLERGCRWRVLKALRGPGQSACSWLRVSN